MVGVALHRERCCYVAGEGLQVADRLAALREWEEARMPEIVESNRGKPGPLE